MMGTINLLQVWAMALNALATKGGGGGGATREEMAGKTSSWNMEAMRLANASVASMESSLSNPYPRCQW
jgi:hypothetical protein